MAYDETLAHRIRESTAPLDGVVEKRMFGGLAFMRRGHMVAVVMGASLLARVGKDDVDEALALPHVGPMDMGGRTMGGFVVVAPEGLRGRALPAWIERCRRFVDALPPKGN